MKRSFRVATAFTGAAALAGGYGPAALAATTQATAVRPDIGPARVCGANNGGVSNWVHFFYPNDDHPAVCIGGGGATSVAANIGSFCPGNNSGWVRGIHSNDSPLTFFFHAGQGRHSMAYWIARANFYVSAMSISHWKGNDPCR
jgi:hypothetical protein